MVFGILVEVHVEPIDNEDVCNTATQKLQIAYRRRAPERADFLEGSGDVHYDIDRRTCMYRGERIDRLPVEG
jgi:hypothetical protein